MDLLMNGLLMVATMFAGGYCWVLSRRVRDLKSLDKGLGGAIVTLTRQIELARATLEEAKAGSKTSKDELAQLVSRADVAAGNLRLLLAATPPPVPPAARPLPPEPPLTAGHREEPALPAATPAPAPARKVGTLLSMFTTAEPAEAEPKDAAAPAAIEAPAVPKPRALMPIDNPLRRFRPEPEAPAEAAAASEDDLIAALRVMAGTER